MQESLSKSMDAQSLAVNRCTTMPCDGNFLQEVLVGS